MIKKAYVIKKGTKGTFDDHLYQATDHLSMAISALD